MTSLKKILRPMILSTLIIVTGAVGDARADCDDDCPFDSSGYFTDCEPDDLGPGKCNYSDGDYYAVMGGC